MRTRFFIFALLAVALCFYGCEKTSSDDQNNTPDEKTDGGTNGNGGDGAVELPSLPDLEDVDDVCTKMSDINFMAFCYDNFDVNHDGKVSMVEANAVKTISCSTAEDFTGIGYFSNLESFESYSAKILDLRYNTQLSNINFYVKVSSGNYKSAPIEELDLRYCSNLTEIGKNTFYDCTELTTVELPYSLTSIGSYAFYGCSSLASIELPSGLTSIGNYAFYGCSGLTSIKLPSSISSIGDYVFENCKGLKSIELSSGLTSISVGAFQNCTSLTSIELPFGVTTINSYSFCGCTSLTSIGLPTGLTSIGMDAFRGCSELTSIDLPDSLTSIGSQAFYSCKKLKTVTSRAVTPPSAYASSSWSSDDTFCGCSFALYVPAESVSEYMSSEGWSKHATSIEAISD